MSTAVVIPARLASARLPDKPLLELGGVPLVVRTAWQAQKAKLGRVIIATDAEAVAEAAGNYGLDVVHTGVEHTSGTERVAEVARRLGLTAVVNVQADEPFVHPNDVAALGRTIETGQVDLATLRRPIHDATAFANPNIVKVVCDDAGNALYFSRAPIPFDRDGSWGLESVFCHVGLYAYGQHALAALAAAAPHPLEQREKLEQLRALAMGLKIRVLDAQYSGLGIDTPDDLERGRNFVAQLGEAAFPDLVGA